ncbi:hypothetical protein V5799_015847 [Amblyomma americanum]|uniref:BTB domain-containing protein n=1 Tax=Amblyomma americanum TaxID=6943 RepID=A0AAQ4F869_AMBAM
MENAAPKSHRPIDRPFWQQKLPGWSPVFNAGNAALPFLLAGFIFVPVGVAVFLTTSRLQEYQFDYTECKQVNTNRTCAAVIAREPSKSCVCYEIITLPEDFRQTVNVYYGLTSFYQNFRFYVQSRDEKQLLGNPHSARYACKPYDEDRKTGYTVFPCGAIANSLFNALGDGSCGRDVIMRVQGDQILEARSERLRGVSRFFKRTLTDNAKVDGKYMLSITGISKEVLETLLEYAETGTLTLYDHEVAEVYYAAHRLEMPFVVHKCLQTQPAPGPEAPVESQPQPAPKSPKSPPPLQPPAGAIGETTPRSKPAADSEHKDDQVQAPETHPETEIPRILRIAPQTKPISAQAQDYTYKSAGKPASPKTKEQDALPAGAVRSPSRQKIPGVSAHQEAKPGSPRHVSASRIASPKSVAPRPGTPVQGPRTPVQKAVVEEAIGPVTSQAQVQSAVEPPRVDEAKEQPEEKPRPLSLASPSASARTFLDIVLAHFKQLAPEWIRTLVPDDIIRHLRRDDLETCWYVEKKLDRLPLITNTVISISAEVLQEDALAD